MDFNKKKPFGFLAYFRLKATFFCDRLSPCELSLPGPVQTACQCLCRSEPGSNVFSSDANGNGGKTCGAVLGGGCWSVFKWALKWQRWGPCRNSFLFFYFLGTRPVGRSFVSSDLSRSFRQTLIWTIELLSLGPQCCDSQPCWPCCGCSASFLMQLHPKLIKMLQIYKI